MSGIGFWIDSAMISYKSDRFWDRIFPYLVNYIYISDLRINLYPDQEIKSQLLCQLSEGGEPKGIEEWSG